MTGCSTCYFGGKKIDNKGDESSPFVIVGESPGIMEIHYGKPFVGDSGKVLEETLKQVGITEDIKPYYTNAIMCLPRKKTPESLAAACIACRDRLLADLKKYPRKVILVLGNGALWSVLGDFNLKITKERGKLFKSPLASVGVVAAVHPAFLLRGGGNFKQFQMDLRYSLDLVREGEVAMKLPNGSSYRVLETERDAHRFEEELHSLPDGTLVAKDIETTGFNYQTDRILCMGFQHTPKLITIVPGELIRPGMFQRRLRQGWHNGKFDMRFLRYYGCSDAFVDEDSMLLSYALNERRGIHDLDAAASDYLGSPNHKHMVDPYIKGTIIDAHTGKKRKRNYGDIPWDILVKYTALDLSDTYQLIELLKPQVMEDRHLRKFYTEHLLEGSEYLTKVEMNGMLTDDLYVARNHQRLIGDQEVEKEILNKAAREVIGHDLNPNSWQQVKALLYDGLKLAPSTWSTDDDTLDKLLEMHPKQPVVESLKRYRRAAKLHGTYVKPLIKDRTSFETKKESVVYPDGRVHQTYLLHGTATSRLACRDMNVQNVPREPLLRGQFIPRKGYGILEVDYSQAELRSLACLSGCPDLMGIFLSGKDLHVELSIFLFGPNFTKEDKMKAKTVNFGIVYGRTAPSIAEAFDVPIAEAQKWIDGWFARFPVAAQFIQKCRMAPVLEQTMITCFGNKKRPGVVSRDKLNDLQNESANFPHQSTASNLTVRAGIELFDPLRDDYDTHIINTVHDCIVTETPLDSDHIKMVANVIVQKMESIAPRYPGLNKVPFKAEPEFGLRWGNLLKFKEIEEQYQWDLSKVPDFVAAH